MEEKPRFDQLKTAVLELVFPLTNGNIDPPVLVRMTRSASRE